MTNWDDFRYFLALAQSGNLSAAAVSMQVSQPTMGRRIKDLESKLNAKLFERRSVGYVLTSAGEKIRDLAAQMEAEAMAIERRVAGTDTRPTGRVCIAATEGLAKYWLVPQLAALKQTTPGLDIELAVGIPMSDLLRREADVALRIGTPGSDQLVGRKLGRLTAGLYGSPAYLDAHGEPVSLKSLGQHSIIESQRTIEDIPQARILRHHARAARVAFRSDHVDTQMAAARQGLGLVPLLAYMRWGAPELKRVLVSAFDVKLDLWLLTHEDLRESARIRVVLDFIADAFRRDMAALNGEGDAMPVWAAPS